MARRYCFAPGCKSGYSGNKEKVSMFKVPKNKLNEWSAVIARMDKELTINDALCEKHFLKDDIVREVVTETYTYPLKIPRLRDNARPCIWPNFPSYLTKMPVRKSKRRIIEKYEDAPPLKYKIVDDEISNGPSTSHQCDLDVCVDVSQVTTTSADKNQSWLHNLFNKLWKNVIRLPSESWTIKFYDNIIAIFETTVTEEDILIKKKVILTKSFLKFFIFQHLYAHLTVESNKEIVFVADFEKILKDFDEL